MKVRNTVAWAGIDFSYAVGDIIDLPETTALARIAEGLAEALPNKKAPPAAEPTAVTAEAVEPAKK